MRKADEMQSVNSDVKIGGLSGNDQHSADSSSSLSLIEDSQDGASIAEDSQDDVNSIFSGCKIGDVCFSFQASDLETQTMLLSHYTKGFATLMGPLVQTGCDFMKLMDDDQKDKFREFISNEIRLVRAGKAEELGARCRIRVYPPHLESAKLSLSATATLVFQQGNPATETSTEGFPPSRLDDLVIATQLDQLAWHQGRKHRTRGEGKGKNKRAMAALTIDVSAKEGFDVRHVHHDKSPIGFITFLGHSFLKLIDRPFDFQEKVYGLVRNFVTDGVVERHVKEPLGLYCVTPPSTNIHVPNVGIWLMEWKVDEDDELEARIELRHVNESISL
jgi:hypothetical protein